MNPTEYKEKITALMNGGASGGIPENVRKYFEGHWQRFELSLDMFRNNLMTEDIRSVQDVGTGYPFVSYWFHYVMKSKVTCLGLHENKHLPRGVDFTYLNLCFLPYVVPRDLIICTEVLEHLPCDISKVLDWLCFSAKKYLFISLPMGGINAKDHFTDMDQDFKKDHTGHLREFNDHEGLVTAGRIIENGFGLVESGTVRTSLYNAPIRHLLFKRNGYEN